MGGGPSKIKRVFTKKKNGKNEEISISFGDKGVTKTHNPMAYNLNPQQRVSLTISGEPSIQSFQSDTELYDNLITQMQVMDKEKSTESELLKKVEDTFQQLKDKNPEDVYAQYQMMEAAAWQAEDWEYGQKWYEHCKTVAKTFWDHNSVPILNAMRKRPSTEYLTAPDGKVYVQGELRDKPKQKAQVAVPVENSVSSQNSQKSNSNGLARQGYYDVVDNQNAFAPISGGHGYYPQYGHGSSYQPQMIGGYEQYDMLMVPLAMLLFCLICIACFLCNAFIGFGCYFAGKTLVDGHKTEVEKEYDFSAV